jgi:hypothetical protein
VRQIGIRIVCRCAKAGPMASCTFEYIVPSGCEETHAECVGHIYAKPASGQDITRKIADILGNDRVGTSSHRSGDDVDVVGIGKDEFGKDGWIGIEIRPRKSAFHLRFSALEGARRIAKLVIATAHPFGVNTVGPGRAESPGFGYPQQKIPYTAFEQHAGVEDIRFHRRRHCGQSMAKRLCLGGEALERLPAWSLFLSIGKEGTHRDSMMRSDHPIGQNALFQQVHQIWSGGPDKVGSLLGGELVICGNDLHSMARGDKLGCLEPTRKEGCWYADILAANTKGDEALGETPFVLYSFDPFYKVPCRLAVVIAWCRGRGWRGAHETASDWVKSVWNM